MQMTNHHFVPAGMTIQGIRLLNLSLDESVAAIEASLLSRTQMRVSFVNADCVNIASVNPAYRTALAQSDWVFIDGIGMRIAGTVLGQPVRDNVNGTDLFPRLCQMMAQHGLRLFLLGARPGIADAVAQWVTERFPTLQIAGTQDGYYAPHEEEQVLATIRQSQADLLLVAMGRPAKESWIAEHMAQTGVTLAMGVGGLFDFYSGRLPRAPSGCANGVWSGSTVCCRSPVASGNAI